VTAFDARGQTVLTAEADDASRTNEVTTTLVRGPFGELTDVFGPHGATHYGLDDWGRTISSVDPATGYRQFRYNGFDEIVEEIDARNDVYAYDYDLLGRLREKRDVDDDVVAKWEYDGDGDGANELGRLVGAYRRSAEGSDTGTWMLMRYDSEGGLPSSLEYRLGASETDPDTGEGHVVSYSYDPLDPNDPKVPGRLTQVTYPSGGGFFKVGYDFDASKT
jgi:YD repeat-containing protein